MATALLYSTTSYILDMRQNRALSVFVLLPPVVIAYRVPRYLRVVRKHDSVTAESCVLCTCVWASHPILDAC